MFLNYDIDDYKKILLDKKESQIPLFRKLEELGDKLFKDIDLESFQGGKCLYTNFEFNSGKTSKENFSKQH